MTSTERKIIWEKWIDPYGDNLEEELWPGAIGDFESDEILEDLENSDNDFDELDGEELPVMVAAIKQNKPVKILATPMGLLPLTEWNNPSKIFNFWVAHTNFRMTTEIQSIIDNTDGVETLDIFSPYRWRIAIAKAFNTHDVKRNLAVNLGIIT